MKQFSDLRFRPFRPPEPPPWKSKQLWLTPDFNAPAYSKPAGGAAEWKFQEDTSMSPFWAVRRITPSKVLLETAALQKASGGFPDEAKVPRINCKLQTMFVNNYSVTVLGGRGHNNQVRVAVEAITNPEFIPEGAELLLQVPEPDTTSTLKKPTGWPTGTREERRSQDKVKTKAKDKKK